MTIQETVDQCTSLFESRKVESPRLSAELLVAYATTLTRAQVLSQGSRPLTRPEDSRLQAAVQRRAKNEPIPYILGEVEFYSISFSIANGVFIPRPETETLVDAALALAKKLPEPPKVFDLGTGCGNIVISMALNLDDGEFWAGDISNTAIQVASNNIRKHDLQNYVDVREGARFAPLRKDLVRNFDLIVSNPPYIKTNDVAKLPPQIKDFEPVIALDGGRDGMTFIRTLIEEAAPILKPGGYVLIEADPTLMITIRTEIRRNQIYEDFTIHKDASGLERVVQFRVRGGIS